MFADAIREARKAGAKMQYQITDLFRQCMEENKMDSMLHVEALENHTRICGWTISALICPKAISRGLIGPNGSGKRRQLKAISNMTERDAENKSCSKRQYCRAEIKEGYRRCF